MITDTPYWALQRAGIHADKIFQSFYKHVNEKTGDLTNFFGAAALMGIIPSRCTEFFESFFNYFFFFNILQSLYLNWFSNFFALSFNIMTACLLESFIASFIISFCQQHFACLFHKENLVNNRFGILGKCIAHIASLLPKKVLDKLQSVDQIEKCNINADVNEIQEEQQISLPKKPLSNNSLATQQPYYYEIVNQSEPILPPCVYILSHFEEFKSFCVHPNEFTCFRTYCVIKKRERELGYIFEIIHLCDYIGHVFMNAADFFEPKQIDLLAAFRQIPRSILVVNGKFLCSQILPEHEPNENPAQWVINALQILWKEYCLPGGQKQLHCCKIFEQFDQATSQSKDLNLKERIAKLVDILAVAYGRVEQLFHHRSADFIRIEVGRLAGGSHIIQSPSMTQRWHQIRQFELTAPLTPQIRSE